MKKTILTPFYLFLLVAFVSVSSCKKDETQTVSYNLQTYDAGDYYYLGSTSTGDFDISIYDVQQAFTTVGVTYDVSKINTAKLTALKATAVGNNFNDIQSITVYIKVQGSSGLGVEIAHISSFSSGSTSSDFVLNGAELKQYLGTPSTVTVVVVSKTTANDYVDINVSGGVVQAEVKK